MHATALTRAFNAHTAKVCGIEPGAVDSVDTKQHSVASAFKARLLIPEGEVLASKAMAFTAAPSAAEVLTLRKELATRDVLLEDSRSRALSHAAELERVGKVLSAMQVELEAVRADRDRLKATLDSATTPASASKAASDERPAPAPAHTNRRG